MKRYSLTVALAILLTACSSTADEQTKTAIYHDPEKNITVSVKCAKAWDGSFIDSDCIIEILTNGTP